MEPRVLNVNVGVLGHVDSGKTSLVKAMSTVLSTAALDKHPQSRERGITLDLGFSAFQVPLPDHLRELPYDVLQFTLVDCPGHASLIRTIIGGAQIIDVMILVIDVTKGIQTQTAECLVIGEITSEEMVIALNKVDNLPEAGRQERIMKTKQKLAKVFATTKFANAPMVPVAARPGGGELTDTIPETEEAAPIGVQDLVHELTARLRNPIRNPDGPFIMEFDHCFQIKGQGTVLTGTVLSGKVEVNDIVEIPVLKTQKRVKSMQAFKRPVQRAIEGDRVGICMTQLDATTLERGIVSARGLVPTFDGALLAVEKIRFYKQPIVGKHKYHITTGHATVMATTLFFSVRGTEEAGPSTSSLAEKAKEHIEGLAQLNLGVREHSFDFTREYMFEEELHLTDGTHPPGTQFALLLFETPVTCPLNSIVIGSRFDTDIHSNTCRLAFQGRLLDPVERGAKETLQKLRVFKTKTRQGTIDRVVDDNTVIGRSLFKKETDITLFVGMKIETPSGNVGRIESAFGKSGKFKVYFPGGGLTGASGPLLLRFKRYVFDPTKKIIQS